MPVPSEPSARRAWTPWSSLSAVETDDDTEDTEGVAARPDGDGDGGDAPELNGAAAVYPAAAALPDEPGEPALPRRPETFLGPLISTMMHPIRAVLAFLIFFGAGVGFALSKSQVYTAEARIVVGREDTNANAVPGYASAVQQLAANYARLVTAEAIQRDLVTRAHLPEAEIAGHVSASPIAQSPFIRVFATSSSQGQAIVLANDTTAALISYIGATVGSTGTTQDLLVQYQKAETVLLNAQQAVNQAEQANVLAVNTANAPATEQALITAEAQAATASLEVQAAAAAYNNSVINGNAAPVTVLSSASSAASNRKTTLEEYGALGAVVGAVLGVLLAMWRANRPMLYRRSRSSDAVPSAQ